MVDVYELYLAARKAYEAIPKERFAVSRDDTKQEITLSCPKCGMLFAKYDMNAYFTFTEPIFCCGKLLAPGKWL